MGLRMAILYMKEKSFSSSFSGISDSLSGIADTKSSYRGYTSKQLCIFDIRYVITNVPMDTSAVTWPSHSLKIMLVLSHVYIQ